MPVNSAMKQALTLYKYVCTTFVGIVIVSTQVSGAEPSQANMQARGEFDVKLRPEAEDKGDGATLGRMSMDKQFRGELVATSSGQMLTALTSTEGSAVYVAIERVTGTLRGKRGAFALAHMGTMERGASQLTVNIVPDSGSGELTGIAGTMTIKIEGDKHFYELSYTL